MSAGKKEKFLDRIASENGVAVVVLDDKGDEAATSNNNSICKVLYPSVEFGSRCAEFCGKAFDRTREANGPVDYVCHAGLSCRAIPVVDGGKKFVAIVGRTFTSPEKYREAAEKALSGEWNRFKPTQFFENILIAGSDEGIKKAAVKLERFRAETDENILDIKTDADSRIILPTTEMPTRPRPSIVDVAEIAEWRSLFGSLMKMDHRQAAREFLNYMRRRFGFESLVWLEVKDGQFENAVALGRLDGKVVRLGIMPDDHRMREAAASETSFELRERPATGEARANAFHIFPVTVGSEIRGALGVEASIDASQGSRVARIAQAVAPQLEILRLRDEVSQRDWLSRSVRRFNESLHRIDSEDFWAQVTQVSAELLEAERASLLFRGDDPNSLLAKASVGARVNLLMAAGIGKRVASRALNSGNPLIVGDIRTSGIEMAPGDWRYRTPSFISYPILIGERRVAVMNFTDKASGDSFDERDVELLQAIAPQIAVAIDRLALKDKAGQFEQLSVTDVLTGLLNRRYLQERLLEEINRSKRYHFPVSLLMLDVDYFKSYNDSFGHPAGDKALKIVANILKENFRGADVAARYGGEEFAVLLPQTSLEEANQIAERIRRQIERTDFPHRTITISIGIANCTADINSPEDLIWAADRALYQAKDRGRNNVRIFDGDGDSLGNNVH